MKTIVFSILVAVLAVQNVKGQTPTKWAARVVWYLEERAIITTFKQINGQYTQVRKDTTRIGILFKIDSLDVGVPYKFKVELLNNTNYWPTFFPFASTIGTSTPVVFNYPPNITRYDGRNVLFTMIPRILNVNYWERELPAGRFPFKSKVVNVDDPINNQPIDIQ
jgi:hypothetical protein